MVVVIVTQLSDVIKNEFYFILCCVNLTFTYFVNDRFFILNKSVMYHCNNTLLSVFIVTVTINIKNTKKYYNNNNNNYKYSNIYLIFGIGTY